MRQAHFILYVTDQEKSTAFYRAALAAEPTLNVPGMTEFALCDGAVLGLMPVAGIERLLGAALGDIAGQPQTPRAELYLCVEDPDRCHAQALAAGAKELSPVLARDWGHRAGYSLDPDNHVVVFGGRA